MKSKIYSLLSRVIRRTNWHDQYWAGVTKFWDINTFNFDVVNLGSNSGKYAFNYNGLNITGMNWAIGPQSLLHDFNILKNYFSYLREGATVIIPLCPFSSLISSYSKSSNLKYYTFLHPATIIDFDEKERIKALRIKRNPLKEIPLFCIKQSIKDLENYIYKKDETCNYELHAKQFIEMWKKQFGIVDLDAPLSVENRKGHACRVQLLSEMIDFCLSRNLRPVLVIPPIHPALAQKLTPVFRENYIYSFVREANKKDAPFFDYIDHSEFREQSYYRNSFFLNEKGAIKFTRLFLQNLSTL